MLRITTLALFAFAQLSMGSASAMCTGADPSITAVAVKSVTQKGALNQYDLSGTVVNTGTQAQASNVLQFVDIYENKDKKDDRGIPPLKPGESYQFSYVVMRSRDAGKGTAIYTFKLDRPSSSEQANCSSAKNQYTLAF